MALSRVKTWSAGEVLTASDLNTEFNNIIDNLSVALSGTFADGTVSLPGLSFTNDTDSGWYRAGAKQISDRFYPGLGVGNADEGVLSLTTGTLDLIARGRRVLQASTYAQGTNYLRVSPPQAR